MDDPRPPSPNGSPAPRLAPRRSSRLAALLAEVGDPAAGGSGAPVSPSLVCEVCRSGHRGHHMLVCDACNSGWHLQCLTPRLYRVPPGSWTCPR
eukprot:11983172-Prorocentrum_lima.AAC.1